MLREKHGHDAWLGAGVNGFSLDLDEVEAWPAVDQQDPETASPLTQRPWVSLPRGGHVGSGRCRTTMRATVGPQ